MISFAVGVVVGVVVYKYGVPKIVEVAVNIKNKVVEYIKRIIG